MLPVQSKLALIVDADNISHKHLSQILKKVRPYGHLYLRLAYGDWTTPHLQSWKTDAEPFKFHFRDASRGKNATDMRIAMDIAQILVKMPDIDYFCLATNDADYVIVCTEITNHHKEVIGIGTKRAADALIRACSRFIFLDDLPQAATSKPEARPAPASVAVKPIPQPITFPMPPQPPLTTQPAPAAKPVNGSIPAKNTPKTPQETPKTVTVKLNPLTKLRVLLTEAFQQNNGESMTLSTLGTTLRAIDKAFDPKQYGNASLTKVLAKLPDFIRVEIKNGVHYASLHKQTSAGAPKKPPTIASVPVDNLAQFQVLLYKAFERTGEEWLDLSALVNHLKQVDRNFQIKHYGSATISKLLKRMPEVVEVKQQNKKWIARLRKRG